MRAALTARVAVSSLPDQQLNSERLPAGLLAGGHDAVARLVAWPAGVRVSVAGWFYRGSGFAGVEWCAAAA